MSNVLVYVLYFYVYDIIVLNSLTIYYKDNGYMF